MCGLNATRLRLARGFGRAGMCGTAVTPVKTTASQLVDRFQAGQQDSHQHMLGKTVAARSAPASEPSRARFMGCSMLSQVFAGQKVGIKQVEDRLWLVSFMDYELGCFDDTECRLEPIDNPFGLK